jgi:hypothetical protein
MKMFIINIKYYNKIFKTSSYTGCSKMLKILLFCNKVWKVLRKHAKSFRCLALLLISMFHSLTFQIYPRSDPPGHQKEVGNSDHCGARSTATLNHWFYGGPLPATVVPYVRTRTTDHNVPLFVSLDVWNKPNSAIAARVCIRVMWMWNPLKHGQTCVVQYLCCIWWWRLLNM